MRSRPLPREADFQSAFPIDKPRLQGSGRAFPRGADFQSAFRAQPEPPFTQPPP